MLFTAYGTTKPSTEYATKYSNSTTTYSGSKIYEVGKIGDATKEVNAGNSNSYNWFSDNSYFLNASSPFFERGGKYADGDKGGVFSSGRYVGDLSIYYGFHLVLAF